MSYDLESQKNQRKKFNKSAILEISKPLPGNTFLTEYPYQYQLIYKLKTLTAS